MGQFDFQGTHPSDYPIDRGLFNIGSTGPCLTACKINEPCWNLPGKHRLMSMEWKHNRIAVLRLSPQPITNLAYIL